MSTAETPNQPTILVIEDDLAQRDLISLVMSRVLNCKVVSAGNGVDGLALYAELHPQVIILDILLPQMNGLDFLRQLKEENPKTNCAIFVISGLGYREVVQQAIENGARDFLVKPFDIQILAERVKEALAEQLLSADSGKSLGQ